MAYLSYVAVTVTVGAARVNLLDLIRAIEPNCPPTARELTIQQDPGDAGGTDIAVGDAQLGAGRRGYRLQPGDSRTYRSNIQNVGIANKFVLGSGAGLKLNVEVEVA